MEEAKETFNASDVIESMIEEFRAHLILWEQEYKKKLRQKEEEVIQAERLASIGRLAAGIAHEINNPLTNILTSAHYVLGKMKEDDPLREDIQIIVNETMRCREIVKGLLDFSRQSRPQKKRTDIHKIIEDAIHLVENKALFKNILIIKAFGELPEIEVDECQMKQVFLNLLLNAAEAMPNGGSIQIQTSLKEKFVELKFQDTGHGIEEKHLNKIFDPFFTTKEYDPRADLGAPFGRIERGGIGLGLSVSRGIIEHHGGKIHVESKVGKGTTFIILLPIT